MFNDILLFPNCKSLQSVILVQNTISLKQPESDETNLLTEYCTLGTAGFLYLHYIHCLPSTSPGLLTEYKANSMSACFKSKLSKLLFPHMIVKKGHNVVDFFFSSRIRKVLIRQESCGHLNSSKLPVWTASFQCPLQSPHQMQQWLLQAPLLEVHL